jgi:hypothetical protein
VQESGPFDSGIRVESVKVSGAGAAENVLPVSKFPLKCGSLESFGF